jgi:hypothetical protein
MTKLEKKTPKFDIEFLKGEKMLHILPHLNRLFTLKLFASNNNSEN